MVGSAVKYSSVYSVGSRVNDSRSVVRTPGDTAAAISASTTTSTGTNLTRRFGTGDGGAGVP